MRILDRFFASRPDPRDDVRALWSTVVELARDPAWYRDCGVADTLEGRFDMVSTVLAFTLIRMTASPALAPHSAALTEIFVEEMDGQLRQSGVGDLMVGKQIGKLMATLGGRIGAYRSAMAVGSAELTQAVHRNITLADETGAHAVGLKLAALAERMAALPDETVLAGDFA